MHPSLVQNLPISVLDTSAGPQSPSVWGGFLALRAGGAGKISRAPFGAWNLGQSRVSSRRPPHPSSHGSGVPVALLPRPSMNSQWRKGGKTISDLCPAPRPSWLRVTRLPKLPCDPAPAGPMPAALGRPGEKGKERCNHGKRLSSGRSLKNSRVKGGKHPLSTSRSIQELPGYLQVLLTPWLAGAAVRGRGTLLPCLSCFIS